MPRAKKAQGNQHNSRHENGIVAPGKRVTKQRSNGHLNGSPETSASATAPPLPTATSRTAPAIPDPRVDGAPTGTRESSGQHGALANGSVKDLTEALEEHPQGIYQDGTSQHSRHRKTEARATKGPVLPRDSILNLALTILQACPLGDTIAILLVLLWLPSTLLTVTNALFAVITFMPPTVALPSFPPTFSDLLVGSGNTPSLATIFLTDVIGLVLWLVIWTPLQTIAIELAQAVVATTLGGGGSGKKQGSDRTLFCMGLVAINHVIRHDWLPRKIFGFDWPAILSKIPYVSQNTPSLFAELNDNEYVAARSPAGWLRVLIALHILTQGLVHVARRWYQREYGQAISNNKRPDPEATPGTSNRTNNVSAVDVGIQPPTPTSPDGPIKSMFSKDLREKISQGKKRRRQGALVRSQQPLWAAFAATKLTVLRELEQSQALKEVATSGATDVRNLGSAQFEIEGGRVWLSEVQPEGFRIETSLATSSENMIGEIGADLISKPFRVQINDMEWVSIKFEKRLNEVDVERWSCIVFGLSPASSYRCSLIRNEDGLVVYSATITTPPAQVQEQQGSAPSATSLQAYRPASPKSPITTLQKSIAAAEASLSESQARQKRVKKENKANAANSKREIDVLNSKINKLAGEEKAHNNRNLQWTQLTRQADDALAAISSEIESLGSIPKEELKQSKEKEATWDEVKRAQASTREELNRTKEEVQKEKAAAQSEAATSQQKRERLVARKAKLTDQHERLEAATAHGIDEIQRKNSEQAVKDLERFQVEQSYTEQMQYLMRAVQDTRLSTQRLGYQQQSVEAAFHQRQMMENVAPPERPLTPEGDLPGTNPQNSVHHSGFRAPTFGSPSNPTTGLRSHSGSLRHGDTRPRSTSGLSGTSAFADFDDQDPAPPMPTRAVEVIRERGQMHSRNSGHGSGSSGSQRDPASPIGGHGLQGSPVGKNPVWNP